MTLAGHRAAGPDFRSPVSLDIAQWVLVGPPARAEQGMRRGNWKEKGYHSAQKKAPQP